jgi:hypothetical protein
MACAHLTTDMSTFNPVSNLTKSLIFLFTLTRLSSNVILPGLNFLIYNKVDARALQQKDKISR